MSSVICVKGGMHVHVNRCNLNLNSDGTFFLVVTCNCTSPQAVLTTLVLYMYIVAAVGVH